MAVRKLRRKIATKSAAQRVVKKVKEATVLATPYGWESFDNHIEEYKEAAGKAEVTSDYRQIAVITGYIDMADVCGPDDVNCVLDEIRNYGSAKAELISVKI